MKDFLQKNWALLLAFLLPIVVIAGVALSVYIPSTLLQTDYDFVYTSCASQTYYSYPCDQYLRKRYQVINGSIRISPVDLTQDLNKDGVPDIAGQYNDRIFYHDTKKNESHEISFDDAKKLVLSDLITSPDGVNVSGQYNRSGGDFFPFGGSSSYGYYLVKGNVKKKLQLINTSDQYYYQNNFQFLGWVKGEKR